MSQCIYIPRFETALNDSNSRILTQDKFLSMLFLKKLGNNYYWCPDSPTERGSVTRSNLEHQNEYQETRKLR